MLARKSRGTPRLANRFAKILRDYETVGHPVETDSEIERVFLGLGIDSRGLDALDRKLLQSLSRIFLGKPVGLGTLAAIVGEEEDTLEDVIEPYLLKIGFIERTPKGRKITLAGEEYLLQS